MMTLKRSQLKACPYNPRQIDDNAKKKLRGNLKKVGLLQPLIWNKRTGNVVSGHQRLAILDSLSRGNDAYSLDVAVVDLDEKTEKEQVVFLNNELAMGSFDLPKLDALLHEISFEDAGFDKLDLEVMLPSYELPENEASRAHVDEVTEVYGAIEDQRQMTRNGESVRDEQAFAEVAAKKKQIRETIAQRHAENEDVEFFVVLVFKNRAESEDFLDLINVERGEKYISGEMIANRLKTKE